MVRENTVGRQAEGEEHMSDKTLCQNCFHVTSKRKWARLTDKEIEDISDRIKGDELLVETSTWHVRYARALERKLKEKNTSQEQSEVERLRQVCRNVYEVWAGSDWIPIPETCAEGYLLRLIEQMRDEAKAGL